MSARYHQSLYAFGGHPDAPCLHLAHANGFPPAVYAPLAVSLTGSYRVMGLAARPLWAGSSPEKSITWHTLAGDLVAGLESLNAGGVIGVGHSLGGVTTLLAAVRRPDLFRAVVLLDPVLLPPRWLFFVRWIRRLPLSWQPPLVESALRRRRVWPDRDSAREYFKTKALFASWHEAALEGYIEHGTRPRADGQVELVYPPEWEAHIFGSVPTDIWRFVPRLSPSLPLLVVRGERSETFLPAAQERMARLLPHASLESVPGSGHMFPLERPDETAACIREFLRSRQGEALPLGAGSGPGGAGGREHPRPRVG